MNEIVKNFTFFGAALSIAAYEIALLLKRKFKLAILNPLLISVICVMAVLIICHVDYDTYNEGAKYISYLLTPATVCLAVPLYEQLALLKKHLRAVVCGLLSGIFASLTGILVMSKLFGLNHQMYVTMLPKSITTAIGMGVSQELGGVVTITVASIIVTGILGNVIAEIVFKIFRIKEPIARGLALGNASHAIGTAKALELGAVEGAMSSLAVAVAGLVTVALASGYAHFM
ncbi:Holin-like protein CidB [uncultured Roseburia sp.]|uniref:LrgB family protein n=1 Tax=Brotonthovivens ammoniilytica TaxID=2981725 RepID=A0ABT2TJ40_9FIRM|nr:LrgB family protein [Brotonthovivens ammoniilytica]MCU6761534.1 LrgB family protein [Brotonthovivens ammoniilytica]SCI31187.1 Holin-like protein CidB [uncultured Roseburia sp.]